MRIAFTHNVQKSHNETEAEFDRPETIDGITHALERLGHEVTPIDVAGSVSQLVSRLEAARPHLVFNTAEGTRGRFREAFYPAIFEDLGLPFTGSDAYSCTITLDKHLSKLVAVSRGVRTPRSLFIETMHGFAPPDLRYPIIVKPNFEGSSKGISVDSVIERPEDAQPRIAALLARYPSGILVEEFIEGRDLVVPFLEGCAGSKNGVLQPIGYRFDDAIIGKRKYVIYDYELKCVSSDAVVVEAPVQLPHAVREDAMLMSQRMFSALGVRDLGRIDFRVTEQGELYLLEVNALPSLEPGAGIYLSAALAGLSTIESVLDTVIRSAAKRYGIGMEPSPSTSRRIETPSLVGGAKTPRPLRVGIIFNLKRIMPSSGDDSEAEFDDPRTIRALREALEHDGHQVLEFEATRDLPVRLLQTPVDMVFNLAEGKACRSREAQVPALLEMYDIPYTGSDPATMALCLDKSLSKCIVRDAGVATPQWFVLKSEHDRIPKDCRYPVIVKPNSEGSSKGITRESVAFDEDELRAVAVKQMTKYAQPVIVEEFLTGREFTIAVLGGSTPRVLPPKEIVFLDSNDKRAVYTFEDKLQWSKGIRHDTRAKVSPELRAALEQAALCVWNALGCRDVARIDFRLDEMARVNFIECNPIPGIMPKWSDLCTIAEAAGIDYQALIRTILLSARERNERRANGGSVKEIRSLDMRPMTQVRPSASIE